MAAVDMREAIGLCWLGFVAVWLLAARSTKRTVERGSNQIWYRAMWLGAFLLLYLSRPGRNALGPLGRRVLPGTAPVAALGLLLTIGGLVLAFWARATLGGNWSGLVTFKEDHTLVRTGPYASVRHPIYTAILTMFLGTAIAYGTLAAVGAFPLAVVSFVVKARQEERLLARHFPEEYAEYRTHTSMLVPGVF